MVGKILNGWYRFLSLPYRILLHTPEPFNILVDLGSDPFLLFFVKTSWRELFALACTDDIASNAKVNVQPNFAFREYG